MTFVKNLWATTLDCIADAISSVTATISKESTCVFPTETPGLESGTTALLQPSRTTSQRKIRGKSSWSLVQEKALIEPTLSPKIPRGGTLY